MNPEIEFPTLEELVYGSSEKKELHDEIAPLDRNFNRHTFLNEGFFEINLIAFDHE